MVVTKNQPHQRFSFAGAAGFLPVFYGDTFLSRYGHLLAALFK